MKNILFFLILLFSFNLLYFRAVKRILSFLLIYILSLPSIFGLSHFIYEDHIVCNELEVHIHQSELDCSTCDFIRISFDYNSNKIEYSDIQFYSSQRQITVQREIYFSRFINAFDSRGPPANC